MGKCWWGQHLGEILRRSQTLGIHFPTERYPQPYLTLEIVHKEIEKQTVILLTEPSCGPFHLRLDNEQERQLLTPLILDLRLNLSHPDPTLPH